MNKQQVKGRVKSVKARIKEATGMLVGNLAMEKKGTAEKNAATGRRTAIAGLIRA